jgi:hypothetical protein
MIKWTLFLHIDCLFWYTLYVKTIVLLSLGLLLEYREPIMTEALTMAAKSGMNQGSVFGGIAYVGVKSEKSTKFPLCF